MSGATPISGLTQEQVERIVADYRDMSLGVKEVAIRNKIGTKRLLKIIRHLHIKERGEEVRMMRVRRSMPRHAMSPVVQDVVLENAKTTLRKRGWVVYAAEVTDGARHKGYFRCDGKLWTRDQVLEAAAR